MVQSPAYKRSDLLSTSIRSEVSQEIVGFSSMAVYCAGGGGRLFRHLKGLWAYGPFSGRPMKKPVTVGYKSGSL